MTMYYLLPPASGNTIHTVNGRTYTGIVGTPQAVPDFDGIVLVANGWTLAAQGGYGGSSARPTNPPKGTQFHDVTVGKIIQWDGRSWRDPTTGAAV